ncbi:MAG: hypothetical protein GEU90_07980 [Gemmatimonas sp.]|nr:hypothetical protein [Gemmatimonas sp.]
MENQPDPRIASTRHPLSRGVSPLLPATTDPFSWFQMRYAIRAVAPMAGALALLLTGCDDDPTEPPPPPPVTSVEITPDAPSPTAIEDTVRFAADPQDAQGNTIAGKAVTWSSSDPEVAEIDDTGLAVALANGTTTISADVEGVVGTVALGVSQAAVALRIVTQPVGAGAGVPFATQPAIEIVDSNGHVLEDDDESVVTARIDSGSGKLIGETSATVEAGVATFTDLGVEGSAGERILAFESDSLDPVLSEPVRVSTGTAATLSIATQPDGAEAGLPLATQPVVEILDGNGTIIETDNETTVTAAIASGGGKVVGGAAATAADGIATFGDLAVGGEVGELTLVFSAGDVGTAESDSFDLAAGPAAVLSLQGGDGQVAPANTKLPKPLAVAVTDEYGNAVADVAVTWAVVEGDGSLSSENVSTDDDGISQVTYQLGRYSGPEEVEASSGSLEGSPVTLEFTAKPNGRITGTVTLTAEEASAAPPGDLYARLIDATSGATVNTVAASDGPYAFKGLEDGVYLVFAGRDDGGDGVIGVPLLPWGSLGGAANPTAITVDGAGNYPASFQIGRPVEVDPNDDPETANALPVGGYQTGTISDPLDDRDAYLVLIPTAGTYVFETSGIVGPCGSGPDEDTVLGLFDQSVLDDDGGSIPPIVENDDIDESSKCSRITIDLEPGVYFVGVYGHDGGSYAVSVREGA